LLQAARAVTTLAVIRGSCTSFACIGRRLPPGPHGYRSLAIPFDCTDLRTATRWVPGGPTVRFHIGLEDVDDLIGDLERGFTAFAAAR
jgi:hypothetical protein